MNELENEVETFLKTATYLGDADFAPMKASLRALARQIDAQPDKASLWSQFSLLYRYALSLRPKATEDFDPLEALLTRADA